MKGTTKDMPFHRIHISKLPALLSILHTEVALELFNILHFVLIKPHHTALTPFLSFQNLATTLSSHDSVTYLNAIQSSHESFIHPVYSKVPGMSVHCWAVRNRGVLSARGVLASWHCPHTGWFLSIGVGISLAIVLALTVGDAEVRIVIVERKIGSWVANFMLAVRGCRANI